jgi:hypothetical protein
MIGPLPWRYIKGKRRTWFFSGASFLTDQLSVSGVNHPRFLLLLEVTFLAPGQLAPLGLPVELMAGVLLIYGVKPSQLIFDLYRLTSYTGDFDLLPADQRHP